MLQGTPIPSFAHLNLGTILQNALQHLVLRSWKEFNSLKLLCFLFSYCGVLITNALIATIMTSYGSRTTQIAYGKLLYPWTLYLSTQLLLKWFMTYLHWSSLACHRFLGIGSKLNGCTLLLQVAVENCKGINVPGGKARPSVLALSRQGMPNNEGASLEGVAKGAYVVYGVKEGEKPDAIIIGTGKHARLSYPSSLGLTVIRYLGASIRSRLKYIFIGPYASQCWKGPGWWHCQLAICFMSCYLSTIIKVQVRVLYPSCIKKDQHLCIHKANWKGTSCK